MEKTDKDIARIKLTFLAVKMSKIANEILQGSAFRTKRIRCMAYVCQKLMKVGWHISIRYDTEIALKNWQDLPV